jgi:hypothetical protein
VSLGPAVLFGLAWIFSLRALTAVLLPVEPFKEATDLSFGCAILAGGCVALGLVVA